MTIIPTDQITIPVSVTAQQPVVQQVAVQQSVGQQSTPTENLQIQTTQVLPTLAPDLKVGDLIQFLVKEVRANNTGLLYYFGQLIEAKIPAQLKTGDIIKAEVQRQNETVILKIKEILEKAHVPIESNGLIIESDSNLKEILGHKVEFLLKSLDSILTKVNESPTTHGPAEVLIPFPEISGDQKVFESLKKSLDLLKNIIPKENALTSSKVITEVIKNLHEGTILTDLNASIELLSNELSILDIGHEGKFFNELTKKLFSLKSLAGTDTNTEKLGAEIKKLITILGREIGTDDFSNVQTPQKLNFKISLQQIKQALDNITTLEKTEEKQSALDNLIKQIENKLGTNGSVETRSKEEILHSTKSVLQSLETIVQTQEMLNRLEPILNALKEPQLLLFPFLFSGMLGFGEFLIDPDAANKQKKGEQGEKGAKKNTEQVHSYQGVIPLPTFGQVQFKAIQSESKIELLFTVEGEDKKIFLESQLNDLREELLKHGLNSSTISISTAAIHPPTLEGVELQDIPIVVL